MLRPSPSPQGRIVFPCGAGILCLYSPPQPAPPTHRLPLGASLPGESSLGGRGPSVRALRGAASPSYPLFSFLWELSVLKTSLLRILFFWVKGEKCSTSSKWKALGPPAPGTFPRSLRPLGEETAPCKGERRGGGRWREGGRRGDRKGSTGSSEARAVGMWKAEGLFVLEGPGGWTGPGPEMEGKEEGGRPAAAQRCLSGRVTKLPRLGPWGSTGTKMTPQTFLRKSPQASLEGAHAGAQVSFCRKRKNSPPLFF